MSDLEKVLNRRQFVGQMRWCWIHNSQAVTDESCLWDRYAGPRPGRGKCQWTEATIRWEAPNE